jgi:hypothetical protein
LSYCPCPGKFEAGTLIRLPSLEGGKETHSDANSIHKDILSDKWRRVI